MKRVKEQIESVLRDVANNCQKIEAGGGFQEEIAKIEELYKSVKEQLQNMDKDISLYRYKPVNKYAKQEIEEQKIFMNIPSKFDDMFDSNFVIDIKSIGENFATHVNAMYVAKLLDESEKVEYKGEKTHGWDEVFESLNFDIDKVIRVSSLSEEDKNIPLWYYYANKHEGVCIEYSLKEIARNLRENEYIMPVIYTDSYFKYNPIAIFTAEQRKMSMQSMTLVKHDDWIFEKEWRIVQICNGKQNEYTKEIPIKSITFGCETDKYDKREIMNLNKGTEFYEMQKACYGLRKEKSEFVNRSFFSQSRKN